MTWDEFKDLPFWLASPMTFEMMELDPSNPTRKEALIYGFAVALLVAVIRKVLNAFVFSPIGRCILPEFKVKVLSSTENDVLQRYYDYTSSSPSRDEMVKLAGDGDVMDVELWFLNKRADVKQASKAIKSMEKFKEAAFALTHHFTMFVTTVYLVRNEDFLFDFQQSWVDWPQPMSDEYKMLYMVHLGIYICFTLSHFTALRRSDFWEMFIHHITTVALLWFSYVCSYWRIGLLISIIHDCSDIFMQTAKIANYTNHSTICDISFVLFAVSFFYTRLVVYPSRLVYSVVMDIPLFLGYSKMYFVFAALLSTLVGLHTFWMALIVRMVVRIVAVGKLEKDIRSDSDLSDNETRKKDQ